MKEALQRKYMLYNSRGFLEQVELIFDEKNHYCMVATVDVGVRTEERGKREISGIIS